MSSDYKVHIGGLMRCCLLTLDEIDGKGETADCRYCNNPMAKDETGVWRWNLEEALRREKKP